MKNNEKFSIGEFSKKTGISISTLHYYDEMGLLHPEKHPSSGHRVYYYQDIITLQKILSLKFLGYSLEKIVEVLHASKATVQLNESLSLHLQALEGEKQHVEKSIHAIQRVLKIVEEDVDIDSDTLFSLVYGMRAESEYERWMERHMLTDIVEALSEKSEEEKMISDRIFIQLSKKVKELYGTPVEDMQVQVMVKEYFEASFSFLGEDMLQQLADVNMEELNVQELEDLMPSPFTVDEQMWLHQAMEYYMHQQEKA